MKICPECRDPVVNRPPIRGGYTISVDPKRLEWRHKDGEPLCPEYIAGQGAVPALPVDA